MISRLYGLWDAIRDPDGIVQRVVAPALIGIGIIAGAELLRAHATRAQDEWVDWRDRSDKLVRLYGEARDAYWHLRAAVEHSDATGDPPAVLDTETGERAFEALAAEIAPADAPYATEPDEVPA